MRGVSCEVVRIGGIVGFTETGIFFMSFVSCVKLRHGDQDQSTKGLNFFLEGGGVLE